MGGPEDVYGFTSLFLVCVLHALLSWLYTFHLLLLPEVQISSLNLLPWTSFSAILTSTLSTIYASSINLSYSFISLRISVPISIIFALYQEVLFLFDIPAHLITMWNREKLSFSVVGTAQRKNCCQQWQWINLSNDHYNDEVIYLTDPRGLNPLQNIIKAVVKLEVALGLSVSGSLHSWGIFFRKVNS